MVGAAEWRTLLLLLAAHATNFDEILDDEKYQPYERRMRQWLGFL